MRKDEDAAGTRNQVSRANSSLPSPYRLVVCIIILGQVLCPALFNILRYLALILIRPHTAFLIRFSGICLQLIEAA
jgi:hypothetical protein